MEISNSPKFIGSVINSILVNQADSLNNDKKLEEVKEKNNQEVNGYNTTSKLHFKLSEDMNKYATANPTQDKIDKDIVNVLSKHEDGHVKDFIKFNIHLNANFMFYSEESKQHTLELVTSDKFKKVSKIIANFDKENRELRNSLVANF